MPAAKRVEVRGFEEIGDLRFRQRAELTGRERARPPSRSDIRRRAAVVRHVLHRDAARLRVGPDVRRLPVAQIDLFGSERRAEIVDEGKRPRAGREPVASRRETDEPLVGRLVVPVRDEPRDQPQRVELRPA